MNMIAKINPQHLTHTGSLYRSRAATPYVPISMVSAVWTKKIFEKESTLSLDSLK